MTDDEEVCIDGADTIGYLSETTTIHECARKCHGLTQMFAYGTNDFGQQGCQDGLCKCHCVRVAKPKDESCQLINQEKYRFFWYKSGAHFIDDGNIYLNDKIHHYIICNGHY